MSERLYRLVIAPIRELTECSVGKFNSNLFRKSIRLSKCPWALMASVRMRVFAGAGDQWFLKMLQGELYAAAKYSLARYFIVPAPEELQKTEPVTEGIRQQREPAPFVSRDRTLELRTRVHRLPDGGFDVFDDEIDVNRRPMTIITAAER